jgi:hypothetical protein
MKRALYITSTLVAAAWLPGFTSQQTMADCTAGQPTERQDVTIIYGDAHLQANAKVNVKPDGELVLRLRPKSTRGPNGLDYDTVQVTIKGESGENGADWIDVSGAAGPSNGKLTECVPAGQSEGTYYYLVTVDQVGTLDPRAEVTKYMPALTGIHA